MNAKTKMRNIDLSQACALDVEQLTAEYEARCDALTVKAECIRNKRTEARRAAHKASKTTQRFYQYNK